MSRTRRWSWTLVCASAVCGCGEDPVDGAPQVPPAATDVPADEDRAGRELLGNVVRAETSLAYHGFRSITQGPRGSSRATRLRVVHTADDRTLLTWAGEGDGAARRWVTKARFPWLERPELLLRNYRVALDPSPAGPVAWRPTRRVTIEARRAARPSVELLVDAETWLILAESARDAEGAEWRHAAFESLEYGDPPDDPPRDASGGDAAESIEDGLSADARPDGWEPLVPSEVPAGFERLAVGRSPCGSWREDWTDGLAVISLLQARCAPSDRPPASAAEGEVTRRRWLGGAALTTTRDGIAVTLFGTLRAEELLPVLRSIRPATPDR